MSVIVVFLRPLGLRLGRFMAIISEFKTFINRGSVVDLAVGVIIGGAFGKIITSFVNDILMPPIGLLLGGIDFNTFAITLKDAVGKNPPVMIKYGIFINIIIDFIIVAFVIFMVVKGINKMKKKEEQAPAEPVPPTDEVLLLTEIRDLLKK